MDVQAVRQGISDAASAIAGLRCTPYVPGAISPPSFFVAEEEIIFDKTMGRALDEIVLTCVLLASSADERTGQEKLTGYLAGSGSLSIKEALENARGAPGALALDGAADDFRVESVRGHQISEVAGTSFWSATFTVRVWGSST